jgi:hypothetical protein
MSSKKQKKQKYQLPSEDGIDVMDLLNNISIKPKTEKNTPPQFILEIGVPANNIAKQLKKQKIAFDPIVIKTYDNLVKGIVKLKIEKIISKKKSVILIHKVYLKAVDHVYFFYEISDN